VPEGLRGTFKAFTLNNANGMRHLTDLAGAGLTHIHLLPSFDFATVPENPAERQEVDPSVLATYPPDSDQQQAAIAAIDDEDGYNWGYDPFHYTVPEGSYSTDPNGPTRILEFREMVKALNETGLRVVMDVVYNHTNAAGQNDRSVLDRIVPGYYHRLDAEGAIETSSCCPNTASEHAMMEKLMVDSLLTWARAYKVDGFRFDLMGHHMKANMERVRAELDTLTPGTGGVDGSEIIIYGEGWNFGEVANDARGVNATQQNLAGTGIGTFNDRIHNGVRGGTSFSDPREQGFINGLGYDSSGYPQGDELTKLLHISDWIRIGLAGNLADYELVDADGNLVRADQVDYLGQPAGYNSDPQEAINYMASHDNQTLFDTTQLKAPQATSMNDRVRIQNLGSSIVALGQGIPFFHAGQDMLRSKSMDRDSFNSGDWFNAIDWTFGTTNWGRGLPGAEKNQSSWSSMQPLLADPTLAPGTNDTQRASEHFREVLRIRMSSGLFRLENAAEIKARVHFHNTGPAQIPGLIAMSIVDDEGDIDRTTGRIVTLFNAGDEEVDLTLVDLTGTEFELHPILAASTDPVVRASSSDSSTGAFHVPARTTAVFVAKRQAAEWVEFLIADVDQLVADGTFKRRQGKVLTKLLRKALKKLNKEKTKGARKKLRYFINNVEDYAEEEVLSADQAERLISIANDIIAGL
jgi:pullulanase-type alpha-1,6-glucosidase